LNCNKHQDSVCTKTWTPQALIRKTQSASFGEENYGCFCDDDEDKDDDDNNNNNNNNNNNT
jgi:hypothetical protein